MLFTRIIMVAVALILSGCASAPRYSAADYPGDYGYQTTQLGAKRFRVSFNGETRLSLDETRQLALLRAAELTSDNDHEWFRVIDRESAVTEERNARAGVTYRRNYEVYRSCGLLGCAESVRRDPFGSYGYDEPARNRTISTYYLIEFVMGTGDMPTDCNCYSAAALLRASAEILVAARAD